eukprot:9456320-Prorocentrum_lima.AAC.1
MRRSAESGPHVVSGSSQSASLHDDNHEHQAGHALTTKDARHDATRGARCRNGKIEHQRTGSHCAR